MRIPVGISNRHIHLTEEIKNKLFGDDFELQVKRSLKQKGEYASDSTVRVIGPTGEIEKVRVMGPLRSYTQVEILKSDEETLGIYAPVRNSGDLSGSANITVVGPKGEIHLKEACIIANRHIHMNEDDANALGLTGKDVVIVTDGRYEIDEVYIKISPSYELECHLDKDDELIYDIQTGNEVTIIRRMDINTRNLRKK